MANHKSARKRSIQNETKRMRNKAMKSRVKNIIKTFHSVVHSRAENDEIVRSLNLTKSVIGRAISKGTLHKKTGSRKISRLSKIANLANSQTKIS